RERCNLVVYKVLIHFNQTLDSLLLVIELVDALGVHHVLQLRLIKGGVHCQNSLRTLKLRVWCELGLGNTVPYSRSVRSLEGVFKGVYVASPAPLSTLDSGLPLSL